MAKILYGVAGEGFGHASRAHLIGQRLIESGHEVMFAGSHKSLEYLKQYFPDHVHEVFGMLFYYHNGKVNAFTTVYNNLTNFRQCIKTNRQLFHEHIEPFAPDLVITDFEPFTAWWAWKHDIPFVSIDNEHLLTHCQIEHGFHDLLPYINAYTVTRLYFSQAAKYFVINFFDVPVKGSRTVITPPIIRPQVYNLVPTNGDHIVLYSTTASNQEQLISTLNKFAPQKFHVYGYDRSEQYNNCILKSRSTDGFLADLASCKGVIASAGFSLLSECLQLRKKMFLLPIPGQYEQMMNAHYVEKLGLGIDAQMISEGSLSRFMDILGKPFPNNSAILWPDNEKFFSTLDEHFRGLSVKISLARN